MNAFLGFSAGTALYHFLHRAKFKSGISVFSPAPDIRVLTIRLPFPISMLSSLNKPYLNRYISRVCTANGFNSCYLPAAADITGDFENYSTETGTGSLVYKALLVPMLGEIYMGEGFRLDNLDIAFARAEENDSLPVMLKQLEPYIRYINVATSDRENVERELSDIVSDSGLSIFISSDFKGILRNAELVIFLGNPAILSKYRIRPRTLLINYDNTGGPVPQGEFTVISGIEYHFPQQFYDMFGKDIQRCYGKAELTEILMACKAGLRRGELFNESVVAGILNVFTTCNCKITGFKGRRGVLRVGNVLKTLRV